MIHDVAAPDRVTHSHEHSRAPRGDDATVSLVSEKSDTPADEAGVIA